MKRSLFQLVPVLLICLFFFLTSCVGYKNIHKITLDNISVPEMTTKETITTFKEGDLISKPHQILGRVYVQRRVGSRFEADQMKEDILIEILKEQAAKMGADAIIKIHYSNIDPDDRKRALETPFHAWASGLPVKFLEDKRQELREGIDFGVAILPVIDKTKDKLEISEYNETAQKIAQYYLENHGYFTVLLSKDNFMTLNDITGLDLSSLSKLGGKDTSLILLIAIEDATESDLLLWKAEGVSVRAILISKETNKIVWENAMTGVESSYGTALIMPLYGLIARVFTNEYEVALYEALRALETLPPYEGMVTVVK